MSDDDVAAALTRARELQRAGDVAGVVRQLRGIAERAPLAQLAPIVAGAAAGMGFDDLARSASAVAADPRNAQSLYDFGYACIERGAPYLAIPALAAALREVPDSHAALAELVVAYEDEARHADAVRVLETHEAMLRPWPDRYLLAYNSLLDGDLEKAQRYADQLSEPDDDRWPVAHERIRLMLARAAAARSVSPLDRHDVRGWHFAVNAGVLGVVSPYGFAAGMNGRFAYLQDTFELCLRGLHRLRLVLAAADRRPRSVAPLPDRSSQILGLAAAEVLGVPTEPWRPELVDTVVVAYDLNEVDETTLRQLWHTRPGQLLVEHATCWTQPPPIAADYTTLLHQVVVAPWGERLVGSLDGSAPGRTPADDRPVEDLAAEIVGAEIVGAEPTTDAATEAGEYGAAQDGAVEDGAVEDGAAPADSDDDLIGFVSAVHPWWPPNGQHRDRMRSPGPAPSARFG